MKYLLTIVLLIVPVHCFAGAWGVGSFENDTALDWVFELEKSKTVDFIATTLNKVQGSSYIESDTCSEAMAAAEIVASINNNSLSNLPTDVKAWVKKYSISVSEQLKERAISAVSHCENTKSSELAQLWEESDKSGWSSYLSDLKVRLK